MSVVDHSTEPERTLRERFGLERFRPGQRDVIEHVLLHRDVLCVMPTGGGKSLCYQLPALLLDGLTLVVSPLIALMKDQVDALTSRGVRATLLNSTLDPSEQRLRLMEIEAGKYDLVYVAPERFRSGRFVEAMARIKPALLAVDEAHCISEWGHDFRPDYARLGQARRSLGMPPCIALTATATDLVRRDIADQLDLREPAQFVTGFDRPNLTYRVIQARREPDKLAALASALERNPGSAIIYASSRKRCEDIGRFLQTELHRPTVVYHAGLGRDDRSEAQERFMSDDAEVVVATNAFGMGVDKPDIRLVVHYNMPGTLEAYYQEAGRAGRDSEPADCVLLYAPGDRYLQEFFIENEYPPPDVVYRVYDYLRGIDADPIELTQAEIREAIHIDQAEGAVGTALKLLEGAGALERFRPRENMAIIRINAEADEPGLVDRLGTQAHVQRIVLTGLEGLVNRRFGEPVYFHPDDLAEALGLDRPALGRALKAITRELPVDYVPPFRGNAVRILDRGKRSRDLTIDFATLHQRKGQEYDKLDRMIKYSEAKSCRRSYILNYFGDHETTQCGRCDNCEGRNEAKPGPGQDLEIDTLAGREVLLKVLSGVARIKGRFGKTVVAQMLTGSSAEKMDRWNLTQLSTFGILGDFKQAEVVRILDALAAASLVEYQDVDRFRPVVTLTPLGRDYLRDRGEGGPSLNLPDDLASKVRLGGLQRLPRTGASRSSQDAPVEPTGDWGDEPIEESERPESFETTSDDALRQRLRELRTGWARESGLSPAYIFSNETLDAMLRERPVTPQALAAIKGIGPAKLERYGASLLATIAGAGGAHGSNPKPQRPDLGREIDPPTASTHPWPNNSRESSHSQTTSTHVPIEEWTWRLVERGFTLNEAAAIRGLEPAAIIQHLTLAARNDRPILLESLVDPDRADHWRAWIRDRGNAALPPDDALETLALWPLVLIVLGKTR
ncbi:MAG: RecQ family ATP-dependent DNA helicase [Isosphaeraceae bacterium]